MQQGSKASLLSTQRAMMPEQRERMLRVATIGLQWVAGKITIEDVERQIGKPRRIWHLDGDSYMYGYDGFGASFKWHKDWEKKHSGFSRIFNLGVEAWITSNIPRETYESRLGLRKVKQGELIDGVREEELQYLNRPILPTSNPKAVGLNYRLPLPDDTLFDVYAHFVYEVVPGQTPASTFENTTNFRSVDITRSYLTPEELEQRRLAKREKYGLMNLRTGMICPETGIWEGWTENGPTDRTLVRAGERFDQAFTIPRHIQTWSPTVDARWMWAEEYDPDASFGR
ncbi:hypothetical protein G3N57_17285 [Paraburkholderia sp. Se-20369]|nr:hypothetical protein [Paraburkholderia sp. Se-20369]